MGGVGRFFYIDFGHKGACPFRLQSQGCRRLDDCRGPYDQHDLAASGDLDGLQQEALVKSLPKPDDVGSQQTTTVLTLGQQAHTR